MAPVIGIRREDKNDWERRVPIIPDDVARLIREESLEFTVQSSKIRVFPDAAYREAGARISDTLNGCDVVFAVKEIPATLFREGGTYVFFSHTFKGQPYNMDMLRRLMQLKCQLIDYERIIDGQNRRLIFFGRHAGLAGMIDTLWSLGERLAWEGLEPNPFHRIKPTWRYPSLEEAKKAISEAAGAIRSEGLPDALTPVVVGFSGYGNVSLGAQEIFDIFDSETVAPEDLVSFFEKDADRSRKLYKVVFKEEHMVRPNDPDAPFHLQEYYDFPEKYGPNFAQYLPYLTVLMNCIYWDTPYPRLVTKADAGTLFGNGKTPRLRIIGDVSCDIEGAVEFTLKATKPDNPVYVYEPAPDRIVDGVAGAGPVVLAVDNLPCELSLDASREFSRALAPYAGAIVRADYTAPFEALHLPEAIKRALILHQGAFTPGYGFMEKFIQKS